MMGKKQRSIDHLEKINEELENDIDFLEKRVLELTKKIEKLSVPPSVKDSINKLKDQEAKYAGDICLDYWPISDWLRFSVKHWEPGHYFQLCIGPLRLEFFEN